MKTHEIDSRIKKQETQRPAYNLPTWVGIFVPGYVILYLGRKIRTWVGKFVPGYVKLYLRRKICAWVCRLFCTWIGKFLPGM
jgi:hypothetical protein